MLCTQQQRQRCGSVSVLFCMWTQCKLTWFEKQQQCRCRWEVWVSVAPKGHVSQRFGRVGQILWRSRTNLNQAANEAGGSTRLLPGWRFIQFRDENLFNRMDNTSKALVRSFPGRCRRWIGILHLPAVPRHPLGAALIPSPLPSSSSSPLPFRAQLPVWPSTQFQWPPPRSLCTGWDLGEEVV